MKDTLCIGGGHSHHQFGVNLVGFHAIIFTVQNQGLSKLQLALFVAESRVSFYVDSAFLLYKEPVYIQVFTF